MSGLLGAGLAWYKMNADTCSGNHRQHERIRNSAGQMQQAHQHLQKIIDAQKQRLLDATRQQKEAAQQLLDTRSELQRIRGEAFERLNTGQMLEGDGDAAPPAYSA